MKITLRKLVESESALDRLIQTHGIPLKLGIRIARAARQIKQELRIYNEQRDVLIRRLGNPDARGGWSIDQKDTEAIGEFLNELGAALEEEVDLAIRPITESELEQDNVQIPIDILVTLDYLFMFDADDGAQNTDGT